MVFDPIYQSNICLYEVLRGGRCHHLISLEAQSETVHACFLAPPRQVGVWHLSELCVKVCRLLVTPRWINLLNSCSFWDGTLALLSGLMPSGRKRDDDIIINDEAE